MIVIRFVIFVSLQILPRYGQLDGSDGLYAPWYRRNHDLDLNLTYFHRLEGYQVQANIVSDSSVFYPWLAKVVHSRQNVVPYLCTATCVDHHIFVTSARCVYLLKIKYTSIIYQTQRLTVKALVMPSKESKQQYDDIGFIIVNDDYVVGWDYTQVYSEKRTDDSFLWFEQRKLDKLEYTVVGYVREKISSTYPIWQSNYLLMELNVTMNMKLCPSVLPFAKNTAAFNVLCYHSCTLEQFRANDILCLKYHGVEGGAVFNVKSNELMGVATWGSYFQSFDLPVGVAMTNSDNYFEDYNCAIKIRDDNATSVTPGFYQSLCN